jgi:hypothetical protein
MKVWVVLKPFDIDHLLEIVRLSLQERDEPSAS